MHTGPSEAMRHDGSRRTKNLQEEREKRKRREERKREEEKDEREREREREEKKGRKGEESKGKDVILKHLLGTVKKLLKDTERGGLIKSREKKEEETEKAGEKTKNRLRCIFYSSIKPYLQLDIMSILFKSSERGLNRS